MRSHRIMASIFLMAQLLPCMKAFARIVVVRMRCFMCAELRVLKSKHPGITGSITWLLMIWLLASPGYQQQCHRLCRISVSLSSTIKDLSVENLSKMTIPLTLSEINSAQQRLTYLTVQPKHYWVISGKGRQPVKLYVWSLYSLGCDWCSLGPVQYSLMKSSGHLAVMRYTLLVFSVHEPSCIVF